MCVLWTKILLALTETITPGALFFIFPHISSVGQNRLYSPYIWSLCQNIPCIHRTQMVLANPTHFCAFFSCFSTHYCNERLYCPTACSEMFPESISCALSTTLNRSMSLCQGVKHTLVTTLLLLQCEERSGLGGPHVPGRAVHLPSRVAWRVGVLHVHLHGGCPSCPLTWVSVAEWVLLLLASKHVVILSSLRFGSWHEVDQRFH